MRNKCYWQFFFLFIIITSNLHGQTGIPYVINFKKSDYHASGQNWAVEKDQAGRIYFGNSKGLLQYSSYLWQLNPLPKGDYVRSILITADQRIYVGSFEEFGYFERDIYGRLVYTSLSDKVEDYIFHNDQIWEITLHNEKIYFRSFSSYFVYDGKNVKAVQNPFILLMLTNVNDNLYAFRQDAGFGMLEDEKFKLLAPISQFDNHEAVGVLPFENDKLLIPTSKNGLFIYDGKNCIAWKNELNEKLKAEYINKAFLS